MSPPSTRFEFLTRRPAQVALLLLTAFPRLVLLGRLHEAPDSGRMVYDGYLPIAQSLLAHGVFGFDGIHSITTRAPLMPLLLMPGVALGQPVLWNFLLQFALTIGIVFNIQRAARLFGASPATAYLAAAFVAVNPWLAFLCRYASTAVTATFLITCLLRFLGARQYWALGITGGLLAVCHPACSPALVGALIVDYVRSGRTGFVPRAAVTAAMAAMVVTPWVVRNHAVTGRFLAGIDGFGYQYLVGATAIESGKPAPELVKQYLPAGHETVLYAAVDATANAALDAIAKRKLSTSLIHEPGRFVYRCLRQFGWFWAADRRDRTTLASIEHLLYLLPLFIGAGTAIWLRWSSVGVLILISLPTIAIHCVVTSLAFEAMYSLPVLPVLAVMTACARQPVIDARRSPQQRACLPPVSALARR